MNGKLFQPAAFVDDPFKLFGIQFGNERFAQSGSVERDFFPRRKIRFEHDLSVDSVGLHDFAVVKNSEIDIRFGKTMSEHFHIRKRELPYIDRRKRTVKQL